MFERRIKPNNSLGSEREISITAKAFFLMYILSSAVCACVCLCVCVCELQSDVRECSMSNFGMLTFALCCDLPASRFMHECQDL